MTRIKMVALDLDGTTLNTDKKLSGTTRSALLELAEKGVMTAVSTGRVFDSVPDDLKEMPEIRYFICSNGATVYDHDTGEIIYKKRLAREAVRKAVDLAIESGYMFESFTEGKAYISEYWYKRVKESGCDYRTAEYVLKTRTPVEDIFAFTLGHQDDIENLNLFFPTKEEKAAFYPKLKAIEEAELTSSFPSNYELGGLGVSKGAALEMLLEREGIREEELFAAGDSPNDIPMLLLAGTSVAMENAEEEVKDIAQYITETNDNDGVAKALKKYVLD